MLLVPKRLPRNYSLLLLAGLMAKNQSAAEFSETNFVQALQQLPRLLEEVLTLESQIQVISEQFIDKQHTSF